MRAPRSLERCTMIGLVAVGVLGCAVGLVLGLRAYPPTAWAATFEVGIPAAILGAVLGLAYGAAGTLLTRSRRRP